MAHGAHGDPLGTHALGARADGLCDKVLRAPRGGGSILNDDPPYLIELRAKVARKVVKALGLSRGCLVDRAVWYEIL